MGVYLNDAELQAFRSLDPLLVKAYVWLRTKMDLSTRIAGRVTTISLASIAEAVDYEIRKGQGSQWIRMGETPKQRKDAADRIVERLGKAGLISKLGGAFLCFLFPLAQEGKVRSNQTGVERATGLSTERAAPESSGNPRNSWESDVSAAERATPQKDRKSPNGRHIKGQGFTPPQSSSTDSTGVVPSGDERGGESRDRAAPSQDGSLGRPVDTPEDPYRDRPRGASHAGPLGRPSSNASHRDRALPSEARGPALPAIPPNHPGPNDAPDLSAENESAPLDASAGAADPEAALREVLRVHAVRVLPRDDRRLEEWVQMRVLPSELAEIVRVAIGRRLADGSMQRLNVGYLHSILLTERSAARRAAEGKKRPANYSQSGLIALASQLGLPPAGVGEMPDAFRRRVMAAHAAVQAGKEGRNG